MDFNDIGQRKMTPKEIDESLLGFVQEIEPKVPQQKSNKHQKVSVDPITGQATVERVKKSEQVENKRKNKVKGKIPKETKTAKQAAKQKAFWDSLLQ